MVKQEKIKIFDFSNELKDDEDDEKEVSTAAAESVIKIGGGISNSLIL